MLIYFILYFNIILLCPTVFSATEYLVFKHQKTGRYLEGGGEASTVLDNNEQIFTLYQMTDANVIIVTSPWYDTPYNVIALEITDGCRLNSTVEKLKYGGATNQKFRIYSDGTIASACEPKYWRLTVQEYTKPNGKIYAEQVMIDIRQSKVDTKDLIWERWPHDRFPRRY